MPERCANAFVMRQTQKWFLVALVAASSAAVWWGWRQGAPKRQALVVVRELAAALSDGSASEQFLPLLALPQALQQRTPNEQVEFVRKALLEEISAEGLTALQRHGQYGPLAKLFPAEAEAWAAQAGVDPANCVAFRLDRGNGPRAEVVLVKPPASRDNPASAPACRIVRVNNVKPLAPTSDSTTNSRP